MWKVTEALSFFFPEAKMAELNASNNITNSAGRRNGMGGVKQKLA